ncbi:MAG TPA: hypothetical protein VGK86_02035 [Thermoanaerobaculia bacterium]|jgi:hypothetical protein
MDEASRARIRVFLNDPAARGQHPVPSDPPLETERRPWGFRVEGKAVPPRSYEPDTPEFLYWQIASALARGRALWSRLLPGAGTWVRGAVLPAVPVEGEDLNAFYDRKALHFFRDVNAKTGEIVQSGDSPDVVTHEQGHAVLDSIRPDLWDAPHFEVAAFHEGFGDLAAILVALDETELASAALEETKGSLDHSNLVSRLAEELAAAVIAKYGPDAALPDALRDAVNSFSYIAPKSLPDEGPADALSREPHSFSRVVTGACWDVLVRLSLAGNGSDRLAALQKASQEVGRLVAAAAESTAPAASFFRRFATELQRAASGDDATRKAVTEALITRELISARDVGERGARPEVRAATGFEPEPLTTRVLDSIRERLGALRDEEILVRASRRDGSLSGRRIRYLVLSGPEYGPADGAAVEISDSFTVAVEESGYVTAARVESAGPEEEEDAREFVRTLARLDRISADDDAPSSSARLYKEGKSHFVSLERDGARRLRRAWVARGGR